MSLRYIHVVVIHNWLLTCIQIPLYIGTLFILLSVDEHWTVSSLTNYEWSCYKDTLPSAPRISLCLTPVLFSELCFSVIYSKRFPPTPLFEIALLITLWSLISCFTTSKYSALPSFALYFLQKRKTEIILVRGLRINRENRICLYTDIEKQSQQNIVM